MSERKVRKPLLEVKQNRQHGEQTLTSLVAVMLPLEVLVAALIVGLMTWLNVRERRAEIGLLRALGKRTSQIASLFLVKAVLVGVLGGAIACLLCLLASLIVGGSSHGVAASLDVALFRPATSLLLLTVVGRSHRDDHGQLSADAVGGIAGPGADPDGKLRGAWKGGQAHVGSLPPPGSWRLRHVRSLARWLDLSPWP